MDLLNTNTWKKQREYGLKGTSGDGSSPILYGQYLDYNWDANVSASESRSCLLAWPPARSGLACSAWSTTATTAPRSSTTTVLRRRSFYEFSNIFGNVSYIGNYTRP